MLARFTEQPQPVCAVLLEDGGDRVLMLSSTELWFHRFLNDALVTKPGDKDVVKKIKDAIREILSTRYQDEGIETMLSVAMYIVPRFKKRPFLTAERKASVKSHLKYELEILILDERWLEESQGKVTFEIWLILDKRQLRQGAGVITVISAEEEQ